MVDVILGLQWGDEGKGKIVDYFAPRYDLIARFQGGPNAGHTLYVKDKKIVLHQIPSGIFHEKTLNLIGNGVVLDPVTLKRECESVAAFGVDYRKNLYISQRTHLILPTHRALDKASEVSKGQEKIGSTLKGIGPAYMDKTGRNGLRVGDLLDKPVSEGGLDVSRLAASLLLLVFIVACVAILPQRPGDHAAARDTGDA